ncbi:MAG: DUF2764 family protein [Waddliaceae bacterium]
MTKNYYYLASALPDLHIGNPPDLNFASFDELLKTNLTSEDYRQVSVIRRYYDINNIRAFWLGGQLDPHGVYNAIELEESLLTQEGFPEYVFAFLEKYSQLDERLQRFPALITEYFRHEVAAASGFLRDYLTFEREWRLVFTGFRAKKLGRDIAVELQFEDPNDDIVAQILAQKDAVDYIPPVRYHHLRALFESHAEAPLDLHQALCDYRFHRLETMYSIHVFSIDRILAYLAQLVIVEKWMELDRQKGKTVIETIVREAL